MVHISTGGGSTMSAPAWSRLLASVCLTFALSLLTGCGGGSNANVTKENFDKLTNNMEKEQVIEILGNPMQTKDSEAQGIKNEGATWKGSAGYIDIIFVKNKIFSKKWRAK
jgi:hypothetical protein